MRNQYTNHNRHQKAHIREDLLSEYICAVQGLCEAKNKPKHKIIQCEMVCGNGFAMPAAIITDEYHAKTRRN
jgi:ribosomal protein L37AE/L43A